MTIDNMAFIPTNGLKDSAYAPTKPTSESSLRASLQGISDQLRDYINNTLLVKLPIDYAQIANVLVKDNETLFTPTGDYNPATKKYVEDVVASVILGQIVDGTITDAKLSNAAGQIKDTIKFQMAGGTATAITLTLGTLVDGFNKTFIASANNNGNATTVNSKPLYKPNGTIAPTLIAGKAYTIWYNLAGDCFFIKASATGTATVAQVLAGVPFSNQDDTDLSGTMPNNPAESLGVLGATLLNFIVNGNFANGINNWAPSSATGFSATSNVANFTATAQYGSILQTNAVSYPPAGHKVYVKCDMYGTASVNGISYEDTLAGHTFAVASLTQSNVWETLELYGTIPAGANKLSLIAYDSRTSAWTQTKVKNISIIDLTAAFGAGLEPTQAQMHTILTALGGWFEGSAILSKITAGAFINNGVLGTPEVLMNDANHIAANIVLGKSIYGVAGTGPNKRQATGNVTTNASGLGTVSGLTFRPSFVIAYVTTPTTTLRAQIITIKDGGFSHNGAGTIYQAGVHDINGTMGFTSGGGSNQISANGFTFQLDTPLAINFTWIAIE